MNRSNINCMNIFDLPDEMLCAILNKLSMVDVFYSLVDVNERFDRVALDSMCNHHVDLVLKRSIQYVPSTDAQIVDQICRKVLPRINSHVYKLSVEPLALNCVLGIANYP